MTKTIYTLFVQLVYGDHNRSSRVRDALKTLVDGMPVDGQGLNIGAGDTTIDSRFKNLEIEDGENIDVVGSVEDIPLPDESLDCVITQEVLEHVRDPFLAVREIARVLKPGGKAYIQLPFIIGFHPCPNDYWRFTDEGIVALIEQAGLQLVKCEPSVGPAAGFYRIAVEFFATLLSLPWNKLYIPFKALCALLLYPVKFLDLLMIHSPQRDRIAGGYFVVVSKTPKQSD